MFLFCRCGTCSPPMYGAELQAKSNGQFCYCARGWLLSPGDVNSSRGFTGMKISRQSLTTRYPNIELSYRRYSFSYADCGTRRMISTSRGSSQLRNTRFLKRWDENLAIIFALAVNFAHVSCP